MKNCFIAVLLLAVLAFRKDGPGKKHPYQDAQLPVEKRVQDLVSRMNTLEKIRQLDMYWGREVTDMPGHEATTYSEEKTAKWLANTGVGSVHDYYPLTAAVANRIQQYAIEKTRLGIPVLFIEEGLHGYEGKGSTSFPIPLQLAAAWDTALVRQAGRVIATESRAHGVHMILGPVLCLPRDPRWGRVEETYGEDTWLAACNGLAMVKGLQAGDVSRPDAVVSEPKHFAVHSIPEGGSNIAAVNVGEREARSSFLPVFEKAIKEGGALSMMAAYSEIDGIPCVDNKWLLTDVLRKEWGFKGFVLSDLGAIRMSLESHSIAADTSDALAQTFKAGMNMQFYDFTHQHFEEGMKTALAKGMLTPADLDKAVSDVLRVKFLLGLFDHPYTDTARLATVFHTEASQALALTAAQEGICLLKNEQALLPLVQQKKIAVVGPLATSTYLGGYANKKDTGISLLTGLRQRAGNTVQVAYAPGYGTADSAQALQQAVALVNQSEVAVVVLGEEIANVGEGKDRAHLDLDERQLQLVKAIYETGKPVAVVLLNGRPLSVNWIAAHIPAIVEGWFGGEKGGLAIADVLLGKVNPGGKLPMTFPRSTGQLPFYYNHKPSSKHKYVDESNTPLFAFGHGLSYTSFAYSGLSFSAATIPANGKTQVRFNLENTGKVAGTEVVQLYVRDVVSSVTTPVQSLKAFSRVSLQPGESKTVTLEIGAEQLSLWNRNMKKVVEPGEFKIRIGSSSEDIRLTGSLWVK
jgi:beta-glucosidase